MPQKFGKAGMIWTSILIALCALGLFGYYRQLTLGLGVTGMRDYASWGIYISNFVFFVAISLVGSLITAIFRLTNPTNPDILYIATNDYIYKSRDGGKTWSNLSKGMSYSRVIAMGIDPLYPATIYAGTKGDAVYKSYDGGQRWTSARTGLDDATISSVVNQFVFDPADDSHMFLATTMGVFESKTHSHKIRSSGVKIALKINNTYRFFTQRIAVKNAQIQVVLVE